VCVECGCGYTNVLATTNYVNTATNNFGNSVAVSMTNTANSFTGNGGGLTNLSVVSFYTNAGTYYWTNNANAKLVSVILLLVVVAAGSGAREATNSARYGGGGGGGGGRSSMTFPASQLPSVVTNIVGAGGTNGIAGDSQYNQWK